MALDRLHPAPVAATADEAIAQVLRHERAAGEATAAAREQALHLAETTRAEVRALADRTERRIRCAAAAFERERQTRTGALDAQAQAAAQPQVLSTQELRALAVAVQSLASQLTGGAG